MHREGGTGEIAGTVTTTPVLGHGSRAYDPSECSSSGRYKACDSTHLPIMALMKEKKGSSHISTHYSGCLPWLWQCLVAEVETAHVTQGFQLLWHQRPQGTGQQ